MILSHLILLCLQSGDLTAAVENAAQLGAKGQFQAAADTLRDAGVESSDDLQAWSAFGSWTMRATEAAITRGELGGLDAYDAWFDVADLFESAAAVRGADAQIWVDWSESLLNANDVGNSLMTAEDAVSRFGDSAAALLQRARVLVVKAKATREMGDQEKAQAQVEKAEADLRRAWKLAPKSAAPCLRLGEMLWARHFELGGNDAELKQEAIGCWMEAARREPAAVDGATLNAWLGIESLPVHDILIEAQPDNVLLYWFRGSATYAGGPDYWNGTRDDFLMVLELNPQFTNAYFFLANGAMSKGQQLSGQDKQDTAEKAYSAAAKFWALYLKDFGADYRNTQAAANGLDAAAANMNWLAGKTLPEHAIVLLEWAVDAKPDFGDAWNNLALFCRDSGRIPRSREAYEKALELNPTDPQLMNDFAVIYHYYLKTEDEKAADLYRRAIERAQGMLDRGEVADADLDRIQTALRDAKNNLEKLGAGDRVNR